MSENPNLRKRAKIADVAKRAGVSATTASLVLNGRAAELRIAEATFQRVLEAAEELNYTPNMLQRSMRRGTTQLVSFYSAFRSREGNDLYMDRLSTAVQIAAGRVGYNVLFHCNFRQDARETFHFLNGGWADGLILFAPRDDDPLLPYLRNAGMPTVLLNGRDPDHLIHSVKDDVASGMRQIADELVDLDHKRVAAFLLDDDYHRDSQDRLQLLRSCLESRGVEMSDELVVRAADPLEDRLRETMALKDPPTAIFCWHDRMAYGLLEAADLLKIRVPDELSVIGYDGLRWPSSTHHTSASVKVHLQDEMHEAMRILDDAIHGRLDKVLELAFPVTFDPGTTVAKAARK